MPQVADATLAAPPQPRLLDRVRNKIRLKHYSIRTEKAYVDWVRRYVHFHGLRHPETLGAEAVEGFLTHLAVDDNVAASTQNQAKSALLFLYKEVLGITLPWLDGVASAKQSRRLPVVLTQEEVARLLGATSGVAGLVTRLLYGAGLRLMEGVRLRVKDIDLARGELLVRDGKGAKDRVTVLPTSLTGPISEQLELARLQHQRDLRDGFGCVYGTCADTTGMCQTTSDCSSYAICGVGGEVIPGDVDGGGAVPVWDTSSDVMEAPPYDTSYVPDIPGVTWTTWGSCVIDVPNLPDSATCSAISRMSFLIKRVLERSNHLISTVVVEYRSIGNQRRTNTRHRTN